MPRLIRHQLQIWLAVLALSLVSMACHTHGGAGGYPPVQGEHIIIAFNSERVADDSNTLSDLAHAGGVPLRYLSPVGPRTHVYITVDALDDAALAALLDRLGQASFIDYAEADRRVHPANNE